MTTQSHLKSYLEESMAGLRHEAMNLFARELIIALRREGYHLEDFLHGLASHAYETFNDDGRYKCPACNKRLIKSEIEYR